MPRHSVNVADVKQMLLAADREWAANGLIATDRVGAENVSYTMKRNLDAYRGNYPESMAGAQLGADQMVANLLFSLVNTLMAQTSARDPEPVIRPSGGTAADPDAWRRAWLNQKIVTAHIREKKFRREADRALASAIGGPFGMVKHGYTPEIGEYEKNGVIHERFKNHTPDLPWIQFIRPWQVRIDPMVNNFDMDGEPGWIAFQNLYRSRSEIRDNEAIILRDDWKPTFHYDLRPFHDRTKPLSSGNNWVIGGDGKAEDSLSMYEEWVVYDASRRTFFGVSQGSDQLVREEHDWPLEWGQLPASILTINEQLDSPFGIPFPQLVWDELMLNNRVWTILNALVSRTRRIIFLNGGRITDEAERAKVTDAASLAEFILVDGNVDEVFNQVAIGQIDPQLVGILFQLKEQIREVLGISSFDRGQRANVETASEADQIGAGGALARSRVQGKYEAFWTDIIRASHRALLQTEDSRNFIIPLIGEENLQLLRGDEATKKFIEVGLKDLQGEFDYGVKLNSTTPLDPAAEFAKLSQIYQAAGGTKDEGLKHSHIKRRLFQLGGEDAELAVVSEEELQQAGQNQAQPSGDTGTGQPIQGADVTNLQNVRGGAG